MKDYHRFPSDEYIEIAEYLTVMDEPELALKVLKSVPGYYRDHPPAKFSALASEIRSKIFTAQDYERDERDEIDTFSEERAMHILDSLDRGNALDSLVAKYNNKGVTPHIVDYGPGDYAIPRGMSAKDRDFTYQPLALQLSARDAAREKLAKHMSIPVHPEAPMILVAYEIIEHLHEPREIRQQMDKLDKKAEVVLISTPKYTYREGRPDWRKVGQQHLRTYTPRELAFKLVDMFPEYEWKIDENEVMLATGCLPSS
jgi:hypothetical protein